MNTQKTYKDIFMQTMHRPVHTNSEYKQNIPVPNFIVSLLCKAAPPSSADLYYTPSQLIKLRDHGAITKHTTTRNDLLDKRINLSKMRGNTTIHTNSHPIQKNEINKRRNKSYTMIGPSSNHQVRGSEYSNFDMPKKVKLNLNSSNFTSGQMVTKMI